MGTPSVVRAIAVALLFAGLQAQAQSTVYRWVDKDGKVQFSDAPPPADARNASSRTLGGGVVEEGQVPYATQIATQRNPVTLYASPDCGELCALGRELLAKRGVPFSEKDAKAREVADELKQLVGVVQVPVLKVGANPVKGFSEELWNGALDQAGYAPSRLPGQPAARTR
jgi:glutaredoxin